MIGPDGRKLKGKRRRVMKRTMDNRTAYYFSLAVEVLCAMENYCLIRFRSRECIVDTTDLEWVQSLEQAA